MQINDARIANVLCELSRENQDASLKVALHSSRIASLEQKVEADQSEREEALLRMYEQLGVLMPDMIKRRFEEVRVFHASVTANRKQMLASQLEEHQEKLATNLSRLNTIKSMQHKAMAMLMLDGSPPSPGLKAAQGRLVEMPIGFQSSVFNNLASDPAFIGAHLGQA